MYVWLFWTATSEKCAQKEIFDHLSKISYSSLQVFKLGLAKSIHHARVLIRQRHIRVRKQVKQASAHFNRFT